MNCLSAFRAPWINIAGVSAAVLLQIGVPVRGAAQMSSAMTDPLGLPMTRIGSGTAWLPDSAPMYGVMRGAGAWMFMLHGTVFVQQIVQRGPRGDSQFGSLNWGMLMASHDLGGGRFQARTMLSLDAVGVSGRGYPLLLQSGEQYQGRPVRDRQHPHDLWMELGLLYERELAGPVGIALYAAPSGEPALGPVAFMHRPSVMDVPMAPLGHHWQDATHISFGVVTAGLFTKNWKVEGSVFNGREPDDQRWNFDKIRLDSYSGRVTWNPTTHWSAAAGYGYLKSPEAAAPDASIRRVTASLLHGTTLGTAGQWATTAIWGANTHGGGSSWTQSALIESEAMLDARNTVFGRAERVQKSGEDLVLDSPSGSGASDRHFDVSSLSLGYIRELAKWGGATVGLGALGTLNLVPRALEAAYGSRTPLGAMVFLRLRASRPTAGAMDHMHMKEMHH